MVSLEFGVGVGWGKEVLFSVDILKYRFQRLFSETEMPLSKQGIFFSSGSRS